MSKFATSLNNENSGENATTNQTKLTEKLSTLIESLPFEFRILAFILIFLFAAGSALTIAIFLWTFFDSQIFSRRFCLSNACVKNTIKELDAAFTVFKATVDLCVSVATVGGIFVALQSYLTTAKNSALTNHIEHLKIFREYLSSEIKKRNRLSFEHIDDLLLYETIFNQSRSGRTTVSKKYVEFIGRLNAIIDNSNSQCIKGVIGGFSYKAHQRGVKELVLEAGIVLQIAPRNDFFETETQLFSLLHRISQSFCSPGTVPTLKQRKYF